MTKIFVVVGSDEFDLESLILRAFTSEDVANDFIDEIIDYNITQPNPKAYSCIDEFDAVFDLWEMKHPSMLLDTYLIRETELSGDNK